MDDVLVGSLLSSPVRTVTPDASLQKAAQSMLDHDVGSVVVVDDADRPAGILTSTDCVHALADDASATATAVSEYMSADLVTTSVNEPIADVAETMMARSVHHVPVVDDAEGVVGMITTTDFAAYLSEDRAPTPSRSIER